MRTFPITITPDGNYLLVTFPDVPEAITIGKNKDDALLHAADALETALSLYLAEGRPLPKPSPAKQGQQTVTLPDDFL